MTTRERLQKRLWHLVYLVHRRWAMDRASMYCARQARHLPRIDPVDLVQEAMLRWSRFQAGRLAALPDAAIEDLVRLLESDLDGVLGRLDARFPRCLRAFLDRMLFGALIDFRRRRRGELLPAGEVWPEVPVPATRDDQAVLREVLSHAERVLEEADLQLLCDYYLEDLPLLVIARRLGLRPDAARQRLCRAKKKLARSLTSLYEDHSQELQP